MEVRKSKYSTPATASVELQMAHMICISPITINMAPRNGFSGEAPTRL